MRGATADLRRAHRRPDKERKAHNSHETEWKEGGHEPLWTEALWESIQAVRRRAFRGSNGGKVHNIYPFRRLAVCDRCGANLYGEAHRHASVRPAASCPRPGGETYFKGCVGSGGEKVGAWCNCMAKYGALYPGGPNALGRIINAPEDKRSGADRKHLEVVTRNCRAL